VTVSPLQVSGTVPLNVAMKISTPATEDMMTNIITTAMLQLRDVLTCSLHRAEYHKTECCKEC